MILKHFTKYNTLSTEQYGFRIGLKTDNAKYKLPTDILNATKSKVLVGGICCDLEIFCYLNCNSLELVTRIWQFYHSYLDDGDNSNRVSGWVKVTQRSPTMFCFGTSIFSSIH